VQYTWGLQDFCGTIIGFSPKENSQKPIFGIRSALFIEKNTGEIQFESSGFYAIPGVKLEKSGGSENSFHGNR